MELNRIEKIAEYNDFIYLRTSCSCGCSSYLGLIFDKEFGTASFEMETEENCYSSNPFMQMWWRIKEAFKVLLYGKLNRYGEVYIKDQEQLDDIKNALDYCAEKLELFNIEDKEDI
jgi:hypothetical protein